MAVVKKISIKDINGYTQAYDVGGNAQNVDYSNTTVKNKLDSLGDAAFKNVGVSFGVAPIGGNGKIPNDFLPSSQGINNVVEGYRNPTNGLFYREVSYTTPIQGEVDIIYIDLSTNTTYRYDANATPVFVQIGGGGGSSDLELGTGHANAYYGDYGDLAYQHSLITEGNPHNVTAADLGIVAFKCYSKTLDVSEESSVTFTDEDFDEDTVIVGIYTSNGLFYSAIAEDTENHTITITYDTTGISDDFKVIIAFIPGSQIIDKDEVEPEPEPEEVE